MTPEAGAKGIRWDGIISCTSAQAFSRSLSERMGIPIVPAAVKRFPDGELSVRVHEGVQGMNILLVGSFYPPSHRNLFEFVLIADAINRTGAAHIAGIIPYLAYSRQDRDKTRGEPLSFSVVGRIFSECGIQQIYTLELHNPDTAEFFSPPLINVRASDAILHYLVEKILPDVRSPFLLSPDQGRARWVREMADRMHLPSGSLEKLRISEREVEVSADLDLSRKDVIFIDDMISTGGSLAKAISFARSRQAASIHCVAVHGLFVEYAETRLFTSGAKSLAVSNTIPGGFSTIDVTGLFAEVLDFLS